MPVFFLGMGVYVKSMIIVERKGRKCMEPKEFINWFAPVAKARADYYGLPASVLIAQGAIESGWGNSIIGEYNFWCRKWGKWGNYIECTTQEELRGEMIDAVAKFQDYESLEQACDDWCILIAQEECYDYAYAIWCATHDIEQFVVALADVYSSNSKYADKILSTIKANKLTQYDA